jgi:hypothetical protein
MRIIELLAADAANAASLGMIKRINGIPRVCCLHTTLHVDIADFSLNFPQVSLTAS